MSNCEKFYDESDGSYLFLSAIKGGIVGLTIAGSVPAIDMDKQTARRLGEALLELSEMNNEPS